MFRIVELVVTLLFGVVLLFAGIAYRNPEVDQLRQDLAVAQAQLREWERDMAGTVAELERVRQENAILREQVEALSRGQSATLNLQRELDRKRMALGQQNAETARRLLVDYDQAMAFRFAGADRGSFAYWGNLGDFEFPVLYYIASSSWKSTGDVSREEAIQRVDLMESYLKRQPRHDDLSWKNLNQLRLLLKN